MLAGVVAGVLVSGAAAGQQTAGSSQDAVVQMEFTNAKLQPGHWVLRFHPDGSGEFDSDGGPVTAGQGTDISVGDIHRPLHLSEGFTQRAFAAARSHKLFAFACESHMKVAYQGTKRLSYTGQEGSGSCEYNYSKDKEIQSLGELFLAVETTVLAGARLEKLLQHDRLGLDQELDTLVSAAHDGNAIEMEAISETLTKIAGDEQVLERARRKARLLLNSSPS